MFLLRCGDPTGNTCVDRHRFLCESALTVSFAALSRHEVSRSLYISFLHEVGMRGRPAMMMMLAMACGAACADGSPATDSAAHQSAAGTAPAPVGDTAPSVSQSGEGGFPRFVPGTYELVLDRDEPLFDDSLAVRDIVERRLPPEGSSARDWRDSSRVLGPSFERSMRNEFGEPSAATTADSAKMMRKLYEWLRCEEWRVGGRVILEANGRFTTQTDYREYCGGKLPAFTRKQEVAEPDPLGACDWGAPMPGSVPHLSCQSGKWFANYGYRYRGDTLMLSSDCDGRDTYVLRLPDPSAQYAVSRSTDVARLEEC
jgi:hypothetical protein